MHDINWWGLGSAYKDSPAMGWSLVTFGIFVGALGRFAKKPVAEFLSARSTHIRNAIEEGKRVSTEAKAKLALYERRLLELDAEIMKMKSDFVHQGELERARLKIEAEQIAASMVKEAEESLKAEVSRALHDLRQEIGEKILAKAAASLQMTSGLDAALRASFVEDLRGEVHAS